MKKTWITLGVAALAATPSLAHEGPRIWIGAEGGKVVTYASDNDLDPTIYTPSRIFATEFQSFFDIYTTEFPGYEVRQDGGSVQAETVFSFNLMGPALYYDDANDVFVPTPQAFGPPQPGPVPQLAVSLGSDIRVTAGGVVSGFPFFTFHGIGDHSHLSYTLLGDGVTASDGPSGIYAISMNVTGTTLATSETYYLLLGKGVAMGDPLFQEAIDVAEATLAPSVVPGDMNCSGALDSADVTGFVQALANPAGYSTSHPSCDLLHGDMNGDGAVNAGDVQLFVNALLN